MRLIRSQRWHSIVGDALRCAGYWHKLQIQYCVLGTVYWVHNRYQLPPTSPSSPVSSEQASIGNRSAVQFSDIENQAKDALTRKEVANGHFNLLSLCRCCILHLRSKGVPSNDSPLNEHAPRFGAYRQDTLLGTFHSPITHSRIGAASVTRQWSRLSMSPSLSRKTRSTAHRKTRVHPFDLRTFFRSFGSTLTPLECP